MTGRKLIDHMQADHGYVTWCPPKPGTREYKKWKLAHETEQHGRWADQQDHQH